MGPILKWAGGKKRVMTQLHPLVPWGRFKRVFEPFLGGGAFFFSLNHAELYSAVLSDANPDLIRFYEAVATSASAVAVNTRVFSARHNVVTYLQARVLYNALKWFNHTPTAAMSELHAGLFLYLNKCGFNGLYRVNGSGEFNTPPNAKSSWNPSLLELCRQLCPAQTPLRRATLVHGTVGEVFGKIPPQRGDFIFCDPPYVPPPAAEGFTGYTDKGYSEVDLEYLENELEGVGGRGALWMLTHRDTPFVRKLFKGHHISEYTAPRSVAADGSKRQPVKELCVRNYG